jgi:hypothetical protein
MKFPCFGFPSDLNIHIRDTQYYMGEFRSLCAKEKMAELKWPQRDYIIQIARFDPAKGKISSIVIELSQQLGLQEFRMLLILTTSSVTYSRRNLQTCWKKSILSC